MLLATNQAFSSADLRKEIASIGCPVLVIQGDRGQSALIHLTGEPTAKLPADVRLEVIQGAGHGLYTSYADRYNEALLDFIAT